MRSRLGATTILLWNNILFNLCFERKQPQTRTETSPLISIDDLPDLPHDLSRMGCQFDRLSDGYGAERQSRYHRGRALYLGGEPNLEDRDAQECPGPSRPGPSTFQQRMGNMRAGGSVTDLGASLASDKTRATRHGHYHLRLPVTMSTLLLALHDCWAGNSGNLIKCVLLPARALLVDATDREGEGGPCEGAPKQPNPIDVISLTWPRAC